MPARLSVTKAQREALLLLPDTEEAFVRHYSLVAEDIEIISGYRTPEIHGLPSRSSSVCSGIPVAFCGTAR